VRPRPRQPDRYPQATLPGCIHLISVRPRRQDGGLRGLVDAHPVQGLNYGRHRALSHTRLAV